MSHSVHNPELQYPSGTQVVVLAEMTDDKGVAIHPYGAVGRVLDLVNSTGGTTSYRVKFLDDDVRVLSHEQLALLAEFKRGDIARQSNRHQVDAEPVDHSLLDRVIFRCVIGSRAYGLEHAESDTDWRGIYLPPADRHWSLAGVPEQLEIDETQEVYWELQKFLTLALKANPNVLECLYSPMIERVTPLAGELLAMRQVFLSKLVFQTYSGYVASQFKKIQADLRNHGAVKWKHVMHLIRLLYSGIHLLQTGDMKVHVGDCRELLMEIKAGRRKWEEVNALRLTLQSQFEDRFKSTQLPDRPDYAWVDAFMVRARSLATQEDLP